MNRSLIVVGLLVTMPALAQPALPAEARARLDRGEQLFGAQAWDAALAEYEAAYELMAAHPSQHVVLFNMAQCHERAARYDEALRLYQRYLDEGGASESDAAQVRGRVQVLEGLLGTLQVSLRGVSQAELWVSGRRVGTAPGTVRLPGGTHSVEVRASGFERRTEVVTLTAGATRALEIVMRRSGGGLEPVWLAGAGVATGVAVAVGTVFGAWALVRHGELTGLPSQALRTRADLADLSTLALVADVSFVAAAVLGAAGVVLLVLTDFGGGGAAPAAALVPWLGPEGGGLALVSEWR
ncbi:MAG: PEGA domain-containing protein [Sandaracinaceae bacterium]|nr:PEGA domain-containing protein [Sandaracinaceae bacterium]